MRLRLCLFFFFFFFWGGGGGGGGGVVVFFFKIIFLEIFKNTLRMSNSLDPDQAR